MGAFCIGPSYYSSRSHFANDLIYTDQLERPVDSSIVTDLYCDTYSENLMPTVKDITDTRYCKDIRPIPV